MKKILSIFILLVSMNAYAASVLDCEYDDMIMRNVVVPNAGGIKSIDKILNSNLSEQDKRKSIKSILVKEGAPTSSRNSICDLSKVNYQVTKEKCESVLASSDLLDSIIEDSSDVKDLTLACKIGLSAKVLMQFNM